MTGNLSEYGIAMPLIPDAVYTVCAGYCRGITIKYRRLRFRIMWSGIKVLSLITAGVRFRQKSLQFFYPMRSYFQKKKFICMPCCGAFWLRKTALSVRWSIAESSVSRRISMISDMEMAKRCSCKRSQTDW